MNEPENVAGTAAEPKPEWEAPTMEEVSERVMAQPYIRFT